MMKRNKTLAVLTAAVVAAIAGRSSPANTLDGTVAGGEYTGGSVLQTNPTGFGNNFSELNGAYWNYAPGGALELAMPGNLEISSGNGLVIFIDSKSGGGIANSTGGGFGQMGSVSGQRVDDWGTDTNGNADNVPNPGDGITATPGGSVLSPNFNPDYAIEINNYAGTYYTNIIDLTLPNQPDVNGNRDVYLGSNTVGGASVTLTYFRDVGFTDAGDVSSVFDNTNIDGVTDASAAGAATGVKGFEWLFEDQFVAHQAGQAVRLMAFITNGGGDYLSNQFLPGFGGTEGNLGGPGSPGGDVLFDGRFFGDQFYLPLFVPTKTAGTTWASATFTGGAVPNGAEQAAKLADGSAASIDLGAGGVTLGYLELDNPAGYTFTGAGGMSFNGGNGASALMVTSGPHSFTTSTTVTSDTRVRIASGASVSLNGLAIAANKRITQAGDGTLTIGGTMANGAGSSLAIDQGTLVLNSDLGTGLAVADRPDLYVATTGATLANLNVSQKLDQLAANPNGTIILSAGGDKTIEANQMFHSGSGKLDLKDGDLVVHNTPVGSFNGSFYTDITGMVSFGRNGGVWDNSGITTSMPDATGGSGYTGLGVATGSEARGIGPTDTDVWNGVTVTGTDTLVMYTYGGDANLSGNVDIDDYGQIDFNASTGGVLTGWYNGDFDYNGIQDIDDYGVIDFVVGIQGPNLGSGSGVGIAAVPEPGSISLLAIGATALLGRRRRAK